MRLKTKYLVLFILGKINNLTSEHFTARLAQANLANKCYTANFVKQI